MEPSTVIDNSIGHDDDPFNGNGILFLRVWELSWVELVTFDFFTFVWPREEEEGGRELSIDPGLTGSALLCSGLTLFSFILFVFPSDSLFCVQAVQKKKVRDWRTNAEVVEGGTQERCMGGIIKYNNRNNSSAKSQRHRHGGLYEPILMTVGIIVNALTVPFRLLFSFYSWIFIVIRRVEGKKAMPKQFFGTALHCTHESIRSSSSPSTKRRAFLNERTNERTNEPRREPIGERLVSRCGTHAHYSIDLRAQQNERHLSCSLTPSGRELIQSRVFGRD